MVAFFNKGGTIVRVEAQTRREARGERLGRPVNDAISKIFYFAYCKMWVYVRDIWDDGPYDVVRLAEHAHRRHGRGSHAGGRATGGLFPFLTALQGGG